MRTMTPDYISLSALLCIGLFSAVSALECYSCSNQDSNREKCIKTSKQCEEYDDGCVSIIRWQIPPYWTPRGNRIHIIEKDCITQQKCADKQNQYRTSCVRDWYLDWQCVECCTGDLCNYYVTMGSSRPSFVIWISTVSVLFSLLMTRFRN